MSLKIKTIGVESEQIYNLYALDNLVSISLKTSYFEMRSKIERFGMVHSL